METTKLVRDKIAFAIYKERGIRPEEIESLSSREFTEALFNKLDEETREVEKSSSLAEITEELADVAEVLHSLGNYGHFQKEGERKEMKKLIDQFYQDCADAGLPKATLTRTRMKKKEEKGGFLGRHLITFTLPDEERSDQENHSELRRY